ncbi:MAG: cupin domain-containing protein [Alphaproteobacteria bacterium]|nr:cupin domain-containing protein [Alphaproteobacteria bacterium]
MLETMTEAKIVRLSETETVPFAPDSFYNPILPGEEAGFPIRIGIQTAEPGYEPGLHAHPYVEILHILEGCCDVWLEGEEEQRTRLEAGDTVALPAHRRHNFAALGTGPMRLMGIHLSPKRIVSYLDGESDKHGYPVHRL